MKQKSYNSSQTTDTYNPLQETKPGSVIFMIFTEKSMFSQWKCRQGCSILTIFSVTPCNCLKPNAKLWLLINPHPGEERKE
jgi:hypothetical protein